MKKQVSAALRTVVARPVHDVDPPMLSATLLARHGARILDPLTAAQLPGQPPPRPTAYIADRLLVQTGMQDAFRDQSLDKAAADLGLRLEADPPARAVVGSPSGSPSASRAVSGADDAAYAGGAFGHAVDAGVGQHALVQRMRLVPDTTKTGPPQAPADAWALLQRARSLSADLQVSGVALDHLMQACTAPHISLDPYHGVVGKAVDPSADYGVPGRGGRTPVTWVGPAPVRGPVTCRRPRVVILDSGTGAHPWFDDPQHAGCLARVPNAIAGSESSGVFEDPLEGVLDPDAGHGTFIAGIIRQTCPDADIVSIEVMGGDGVVEEGLLVQSLLSVLATHLGAQSAGTDDGIVDVISLSLGYYHEHPEDAGFDSLLRPPIEALAAAGVVVVASAGNDATTRPLYPAAFTPYADGIVTQCPPDSLPVVSVSALNPAGTTALFSNAGDWVNAHEYGAAILSTMPRFDGGGQAAYQVEFDNGIRATIDPDSFVGGFATWSGTSFAAPVLAGRIAQALLDTGGLDDRSAAAAVARARIAITALTDLQLT